MPIHGMRRGWPHLLVEFRQDLIGTAAPRARKWADILLVAAVRPVARPMREVLICRKCAYSIDFMAG